MTDARCSATQPVLAHVALALLLGGMFLSSAEAATVGSVFVSFSDAGVPSYSSQRLDASYRLSRIHICFVRSDWNEGIEPWRFGVETWGEFETRKIHTILDRSLLRAGQTVSMRCV